MTVNGLELVVLQDNLAPKLGGDERELVLAGVARGSGETQSVRVLVASRCSHPSNDSSAEVLCPAPVLRLGSPSHGQPGGLRVGASPPGRVRGRHSTVVQAEAIRRDLHDAGVAWAQMRRTLRRRGGCRRGGPRPSDGRGHGVGQGPLDTLSGGHSSG